MNLNNSAPSYSYLSPFDSKPMGYRRRRRSSIAARHALYLDALEPRQLLTGSPPVVNSFPIVANLNTPFVFTSTLFTEDYADPDMDPLAYVEIESLPTSGTLTLNDGTNITNVTVLQDIAVDQVAQLSYVPNTGFSGTDSFTWNASDGTQLADNPASVNITVESAPSVTTFPLVVPMNSTANPIAADLFTEDYTDPQNNPLASITVVTLPTSGTLALTVNSVTTNINAGDVIPASELDGITYTPNADFTGTDTGFTWNASNGALNSTTPATAFIEVEAPTVSSIALSTGQNQALNFTASEFTGAYVGAGSLQSIEITSLPTHGVLTLSPDTQITLNDVITADEFNSIIYTPANDYTGTDFFSWTGSDGVSFATASANVNINVTAPGSSDIAETLNQNSSLMFQAGAFTDALDSSSGLQSIKVTSLPTHGKLTLTVNAVATPVTLNEVIPVAQLGNMVYTPATGFAGTDTFRFIAADTVGPVPAAAGVDLLVAKPQVAGFTASVGQNAGFNFPATDFTNNFSGGAALQSVKILTLPAHGVLTLSGDAITVNQVIALADFGNITYTPSLNFLGSDSFRWTGSDGTAFASAFATANLSVTGLILLGNNTPILNGEKTPTTANFTDFANAAVAITGVSITGSTVTRTYNLQNNSTASIDLSAIQLTGSANFTVSSLPPTLAAGTMTSFTVTFTPTSAGLKKATITIGNDLAGGTTIVFAIQGTGLATTHNFLSNGTANGLEVAVTKAGPAKGLTASNGEILHITYTGYQLDGTVFDASSLHGNVPIQLRLDDDFAANQPFITNSTGNQFVEGTVIDGWELGLQGIKVGEHRTLIIPPSLAYGNDTTSSIQFQTLIFDVVCTAIDNTPSIGITYQDQFGNNGAVLPGDKTTSVFNGTDFGTIAAGESFIPHSFTVTDNSATNSSGQSLITHTFQGFKITGADPKDFIATGTQTQFNIYFKPSALGVRTAIINYETNDPLHPDFTFTVKGTSVAPYSDLIVQTFGAQAFPDSTDNSGNVLTTIPVIIENFGNAPIPSATPVTDVQITIQNFADTTSSPIVVGTLQNVNVAGLKSNQSKQVNVPITIPAAFTASTYIYQANVNVGNEVAESVTTNNNGTTSLNVAGALLSTTLPSNVVDDVPIKGVVNVTVTNTGIGTSAGLTFPTNEKVTINIVATDTNNTQTTIASVIESVGNLKGIDAKDASGHSLSFKIPVNFAAGLDTGSYTISANLVLSPFLPEYVAMDNRLTLNSGGTLTSGPAAGDVAASFGTKSFPSSTDSNGNTLMKLPVIIQNQGNIVMPQGTFDIQIVATNTANTANPTTIIGSMTGVTVGSLAILATKEFDVPVIIPPVSALDPLPVGDLAAGDYTYTVNLVNANATTAGQFINSSTANDMATTSTNITSYIIDNSSVASNFLPHQINTGIIGGKTKAVIPVLVYNPGATTLPTNQAVTIQLWAHDTTATSNTNDLLMNVNNEAAKYTLGALTSGKFKTFKIPVSFSDNDPHLSSGKTYDVFAVITPVVPILENNIADNNSGTQTLSPGLSFESSPVSFTT